MILSMLISTAQETVNFLDFYDFEVGDVFEYIQTFAESETGEIEAYLLRQEVTAKKSCPLQVFYDYSVDKFIIDKSAGAFVIVDTLYLSMPDSTGAHSDSAVMPSYSIPERYNGRMIYEGGWWSGNMVSTIHYVIGCGHAWVLMQKSITNDFISLDSLSFYKKGEETWGNSLLANISEKWDIYTHARIFPNPVDDVLNVSIGNNYTGNVSVSVYDMLGILHIHKLDIIVPDSIIHIDCSALKKGNFYLIQIIGGNEMMRAKIVKW